MFGRISGVGSPEQPRKGVRISVCLQMFSFQRTAQQRV
jgi:hypothetical protein